MKRLTTLILTTACLFLTAQNALAHEYSAGDISVDHPWSRPTPPGVMMGVGYMVITNNSDSDIVLTAAETPNAGQVTIHESQMNDGIMSMQQLGNGLTIPAGGKVELKPHSYHLMLEQLKNPLKEGERIPLKLEFRGAPSIEVELSVDPLGSRSEHGGHSMGMGAGDMKSGEMDHSQMNHNDH